MAHITLSEAQAWAEGTKLPIAQDTVEGKLEEQIALQVISMIAQAYETSSWTGHTNTPPLVRKIIAMKLVAWLYRQAYAEDDESNAYADRLDASADQIIESIVSGIIELPTEIDTGSGGPPSFYPNDVSSAMSPTAEDSSLGGAKFTMGTIW